MALKETLAKKGGLTLEQLAKYDDIITDALVDRVYFWTSIRKNRTRFAPSRGIQDEKIADILRQTVIVEKDLSEAVTQMMQLHGLRSYVDRLPSQEDREHFQRHLRKYVSIYLPDCPFEVNTTNRYTIGTHEASVTARREIKKGDVIKYLSGIQVALTEDEVKTLDLYRLDFSIVMSSRKKTPSLFLGPARFANHDCEANARLSTVGTSGMQVVATKDIDIADEITVSYGVDYFGEDNCECLCRTCEVTLRNGWANAELEQARTSETPACLDFYDDRSYSLRNKRKLPSASRDVSRTATPEQHLPTDRAKRQKIEVWKISSRSSNSKSPNPLKSPHQHHHVLIKEEQNESQAIHDCPTPSVNEDEPEITQFPRKSRISNSPRKTAGSLIREVSDESDVATALSSHLMTLSNPSPRSPESTPATSVFEDDDSTPRKKQSDTDLLHTAATNTAKVLPDLMMLKKKVEETESRDPDLTSLSDFDLDESQHDVVRKSPVHASKEPHIPLELQSEGETLSTKRTERAYGSPSLTSTSSTKKIQCRVPGDYTLTDRLLSQRYSAWIQCTICDDYFVQHDSYETRAACPRCERHSKLYGFGWPKTENEGKWDTELRVTDHRIVHRFVEKRGMTVGPAKEKPQETSKLASKLASKNKKKASGSRPPSGIWKGWIDPTLPPEPEKPAKKASKPSTKRRRITN